MKLLYQERYFQTLKIRISVILILGDLHGVRVVVIARHGLGHTLAPGWIQALLTEWPKNSPLIFWDTLYL